MRLTAMITMAALIGTSAQGHQRSDNNVVTVYVSDDAGVSGQVKLLAQDIAARMFAKINVRVNFENGVPPLSGSGGALGIVLATHTPADFLPGALAYAKPFEGVHIEVFWDRIQKSDIKTYLLAHVLVHEVTHVLQRTNGHSESGVMKAHWSGNDLAQMQLAPLPFSKDDIVLIERGMQARNSRLPETKYQLTSSGATRPNGPKNETDIAE